MQLVRWPKQFDVIVTDNLFGDMLSDIAAMLTGSLGMLPSASLGEVDPKTKKRKAMYEPVHGSAPDIAGKGVANPIAMIASFAMALRYSLDWPKEADLIDQAIAATLAKGLRTADIKSEGVKVSAPRRWATPSSARSRSSPPEESAMRRLRRDGRACLRVIAALAVALAALPAHAYPDHVIRLIVPFPAGGSNDVAARLIAPHLEKALGQTVIVDNRPAAGGIVGSDAVAKATPDGHTLLLVASSHTVTPALRSKLPYSTERDFAPISLINTNAMVFFVNPKVPANSLTELVELAKAKPGQAQLCLARRRQPDPPGDRCPQPQAGIGMQHLPYRGGAPAALAVISGEAEFTLLAPNVLFPHIRAGTLRPIATGGATRHPQLPDVATTAELDLRTCMRSNGSACSPPPARRGRSSIVSTPS